MAPSHVGGNNFCIHDCHRNTSQAVFVHLFSLSEQAVWPWCWKVRKHFDVRQHTDYVDVATKSLNIVCVYPVQREGGVARSSTRVSAESGHVLLSGKLRSKAFSFRGRNVFRRMRTAFSIYCLHSARHRLKIRPLTSANFESSLTSIFHLFPSRKMAVWGRAVFLETINSIFSSEREE